MVPSTIAKLFRQVKDQHPDVPLQYVKDESGEFQPRTFSEVYAEVLRCAAGLLSIGVKRGDNVGLISENRAEWLVTDLALQCLGAPDVPRGNDSMAPELAFLLGLSKCEVVVVENRAQLQKIAPVLLAGGPAGGRRIHEGISRSLSRIWITLTTKSVI